MAKTWATETIPSRTDELLNSKFVQLLMTPENGYWQGAMHALDDRGQIWYFDQSHRIWVPMEMNRAVPDESEVKF